jgi:hypothetical protein
LLFWEGCSPRLLKAKLLLEKGLHLWVLVAYAPTEISPDEDCDAFYEALADTVSLIPSRDMVLILGDFNAQTGGDNSEWKGTLGRHAFYREAGPTENGIRLLSFCRYHNLTVASSFFQHRRRHKVTWRHLNKAYKDTCIDHILISAPHLSSVQQARSFRVHFGHSDDGTSHNLLGGTIRLRLRAIPRTGSKPKQRRFDTQQFADPHTRARYAVEVSNRFEALGALGSAEYPAGCEILCSAAEKVLGKAPLRRKYTGQLSEETQEFLRQKPIMLMQPNISVHEKRRIKRRGTFLVQRDVEAEYAGMGRRVESLVFQNRMRDAFSVVKGEAKVRSNRRSNEYAHLMDSEGRRIEGTEDKLEACAAFFEKLYNCAEAVALPAVAQPAVPLPPPEPPPNPDLPPPLYSREWALGLPLPEPAGNLGVPESEPSLDEVKLAIKALNNNKAPGPNGVTAELLKYGGEAALIFVHWHICQTWRTGNAPKEWKKAQIIMLHKSGNRASLDNYRGISLLDIVGKVYTRVLLNRLQLAMDKQIGESQMGFRPGRSCTDALFSMAQLTSWSREFRRPLSVCFVDLTKAYDSVPRDALWFVLRQQGVPDKLVDLLTDLHSGTNATIKAFGGESRPFDIKGGVRQGCNIAPLLFNIFLDFVTKQAASQFATGGRKGGVTLKFNFEGKPFRVPIGQVEGSELLLLAILLYADDMAVIADSDDELDHYVQVLEAVTRRWGLKINIRKTKIWQGAWNIFPVEPEAPPLETVIRGESVGRVEDFKYLGSTLANEGDLEKELTRRRALADGKFAELKHIWSNKKVSVATKMVFYRAFIPATLLYGCESWATTQAQENKLNVSHMRFLRRIFGVTRWHRQTNEHIAASCDIQQIPALISRARMRWAGHLCRMGDDRLPKRILFGSLVEGSRAQGRPRQRLATNFEADLVHLGMLLAKKQGFDAQFFVNGEAETQRVLRGQKPVEERHFESWWTLAKCKDKWRACLDAAWPRQPSAPNDHLVQL